MKYAGLAIAETLLIGLSSVLIWNDGYERTAFLILGSGVAFMNITKADKKMTD